MCPLLVWAVFGPAAGAQKTNAQKSPAPYKLPPRALVVEEKALPATFAPGRALVLWMVNPARHPSSATDPYTCPEETRGSFLRGPLRVSLVNTRTDEIINTVEVRQEYSEGEDSFDVPYKIRRNAYYPTAGAAEDAEAKPTVLALKDYNGDGAALEFALFDAPACMGLQTTLIGYSRARDRVVQYEAELWTIESGGKSARGSTPESARAPGPAQDAAETSHWVDYLFAKAPAGPGLWRYEVDYRGRGGALEKYEVRYDPRAEKFAGTRTLVPGGDEAESDR